MSRKNLFVFVIALLIGSASYAQTNTSSPYSSFGIGILENQALGKSLGMGNVSVGLRTPLEINVINPASYTALPAQGFLFQVGTKVRRIDYKYADQKESNYDFGLNSVNAAFKVSKYWAMGFGMNPLSNIGYTIIDTVFVNPADTSYNESAIYSGEGGLTQLYLGQAFNYKGFSLGVNAYYNFGPIIKRSVSTLTDDDYISIITDEEVTKVGDFSFRFGFQYNDSIFKKFNLSLGAFYENQTNLKARKTKYLARNLTIQGNAHDTEILINDTINTGSIGIPQKLGFGLSVSTKKLLLAADYTQSNWKDVKFFDSVDESLADSYSVALGGEFTNDYLSKKYFDQVNFRMGLRYTKTNLYIRETQLDDAAVSFGFGFPTKLGAKINLGFEIGRKGSLDNDLIQENYYLLNLNFNFTDRWFVRRKFF
jgi:hypothetical protein